MADRNADRRSIRLSSALWSVSFWSKFDIKAVCVRISLLEKARLSTLCHSLAWKLLSFLSLLPVNNLSHVRKCDIIYEESMFTVQGESRNPCLAVDRAMFFRI